MSDLQCNELSSNNLHDPGIKIHETRIIRLLEVLLDGGTHIGGWTAKQIHQTLLTTFELSAKTDGLNQLHYDLRKLKGHGPLQREGVMPTTSPPKAYRPRCCCCSFTNKADKAIRESLTCWPDVTSPNVEVFLFTIFDPRI